MRSFILIPPHGSRLPSVRIRVGLAVALLFLLAAGLAGYFIPFNSFTPDVVEKNEKRNLESQNIRLLKKIRALRESLSRLQAHVETVDSIHSGIAAHMQFDSSQASKPDRRGRRSSDARPEDPAALIERMSSGITAVARAVEKNPAFFSQIPVVRPFAVPSQVVVGFGKSRDPFTGQVKMHEGIDFVAGRDAPVIAAASGVVSRVDDTRLWGLRVRIQHAYGISTVYAHLGSARVSAGRRVSKGDVIGTLGATGMVTGPHLHYEVWRNQTALDPQILFFPAADSAVAVARMDAAAD